MRFGLHGTGGGGPSDDDYENKTALNLNLKQEMFNNPRSGQVRSGQVRSGQVRS